MGEFQSYIMKQTDLITKMDTVRRLQKLLKEKKGEAFFFDKSVVFKTELARMFIDYMHLDVDRDLVLTACLFCNCKKVYNPQKIGKLHTYAKEGAEYLLNIGFEPRFCKICEGVNRYSGLENREPESDILELVDNFGGMMLDRPERPGFSPEESLVQMESDNLKNVNNRYLGKFHDFVNMIQKIEIKDNGKGQPPGILARRANANEKTWSVTKYIDFFETFNPELDQIVMKKSKENDLTKFIDFDSNISNNNEKIYDNNYTPMFPTGTLSKLRGQSMDMDER